MHARLPFFWIPCLLSIFLLLGSEKAFSADQKPPPYRVLLVEAYVAPILSEHSHFFLDELEKRGYVKGVNLKLTTLHAEGDIRLAHRLLSKMLGTLPHPDLVVANGTIAAQACKHMLVDSGIPMIFYSVCDAVESGIVEKVGRPTGTFITGRVHRVQHERKLELVLSLLNQIPHEDSWRIGFIHSTYPSEVNDLQLLKTAASKVGNVEFVPYEVRYREGKDGMKAMLEEARMGVAALEGQVDFYWEPLGPFGVTPLFTKMLNKTAKVPIIFGGTLESVRHGALLHISPDPEATGREAAYLASKVLSGTPAGKLRVRAPSKIKLGIHAGTAHTMQLKIPEELTERASGNIYYGPEKHVYRS